MTDEEIREFDEWEMANLATTCSSPTRGRFEAWLERGRRDRERIRNAMKHSGHCECPDCQWLKEIVERIG